MRGWYVSCSTMRLVRIPSLCAGKDAWSVPGRTPGTAWTCIGLATFDGRGGVNLQQAVDINGTTAPVASQPGTYTISPDYTGTESDASVKVMSTLMVVHGGDQVLGISIIPGSSMTVHVERVTGTCANNTLLGDYGFQ